MMSSDNNKNNTIPREEASKLFKEYFSRFMKKYRKNALVVNDFSDVPDDYKGPVLIDLGIKEFYFLNGKNQFHSYDDMPAKFIPGNYMVWWKDGKVHRGNGKPALIHRDGKEEYFVNGKEVSKESAEVFGHLFKEIREIIKEVL